MPLFDAESHVRVRQDISYAGQLFAFEAFGFGIDSRIEGGPLKDVANRNQVRPALLIHCGEPSHAGLL